ncbi:MAG TPA: DUF3617 family protein [Sphingomonadaceae bacterium]|nr:DUF3617 family protein [Sphingomonadaceae bacterium]
MSIRMAASLIAAGLLAGCNAPAELEPGLYEQRLQTEVILKRPGHAPETQRPPAETRQLCIERIVPDQPASFLALPDGAQCRFTHAVWADGKADIAGTCLAGDDGPPFKTRITGVYQRTAFDVALRMTAAIPEVAVDTTLSIAAKRVGACVAEKPRIGK